jgi:glycosyltransferase involved in cell wall biosynthesis
MSASPTFGILIPCKNGAPFLRRLFASTRAQTRPFDAIWLYDDGSTDGSAELAADLGARVLRSEKSIGPAAARNRLIDNCECDWLHFHDADDTMSPNYLERVASRVRPNLDLVICDMLWIDEETGRVDNRWTYDGAALAQNPAAYLIWNTVGGINGLYRRTALRDTGGFDESLHYWEDMELNIRLTQRKACAEVVNESLVTAYRRRTSYSNANLGGVWRGKLQIMERLLPDANSHLRNVIATEAETIADRQAALNLWTEVPFALTLARSAGGNPPSTKSLLLRALKWMLPAAWAFRIQYRFRKSSTK